MTKAQCATPTCITAEMIEVANHANVIYSPALANYEFLFMERGDNTTPALTNVTVYRQEAAGKLGEIVNYPDAFCTMEGYAYGRLTRVETGVRSEPRPVIIQVPVEDADGNPVLQDREVIQNVDVPYSEIVQYNGCEP